MQNVSACIPLSGTQETMFTSKVKANKMIGKRGLNSILVLKDDGLPSLSEERPGQSDSGSFAFWSQRRKNNKKVPPRNVCTV